MVMTIPLIKVIYIHMNVNDHLMAFILQVMFTL